MSRMKSNQIDTFRERVAKENRLILQFEERWGWLVEEYAKQEKELEQFKSKGQQDEASKLSLKPYPITTARMIGWLSTRPDCKLDIYGPDVPKAPPLPDIYVIFVMRLMHKFKRIKGCFISREENAC